MTEERDSSQNFMLARSAFYKLNHLPSDFELIRAQLGYCFSLVSHGGACRQDHETLMRVGQQLCGVLVPVPLIPQDLSRLSTRKMDPALRNSAHSLPFVDFDDGICKRDRVFQRKSMPNVEFPPLVPPRKHLVVAG